MDILAQTVSWAEMIINGSPWASNLKREVKLVRLRVGLGGQSLPVTEVATTLRLGRERVRKIEAIALAKIEKVFPQSTT